MSFELNEFEMMDYAHQLSDVYLSYLAQHKKTIPSDYIIPRVLPYEELSGIMPEKAIVFCVRNNLIKLAPRGIHTELADEENGWSRHPHQRLDYHILD